MNNQTDLATSVAASAKNFGRDGGLRAVREVHELNIDALPCMTQLNVSIGSA
jgi:hypothetical protein